MKILLGVIAAVVAVAVGGMAYLYLAGGSGEPTTELTTPTLADATTTPPTSEPTSPSTEEPETTPQTEAEEAEPEDATGATAYVISAEESEARFELDEVLRGEPAHVVGTTSEVAGQIRFDPTDLTGAELSEIVVNARTLQTDSSNRDRAIRGPVVLNSASDEFELITFSPTALDGLPEEAEVGDVLEFTIDGDLSIKGTTLPVTFDAEVTWVEEGRIEGTVSTTVDRTDFGIDIPSVASVADVTEEVLIALDFAAVS